MPLLHFLRDQIILWLIDLILWIAPRNEDYDSLRRLLQVWFISDREDHRMINEIGAYLFSPTPPRRG